MPNVYFYSSPQSVKCKILPMPLSITELCLLGVVARNLVRSAICFIHAQWGLNLASTETNEFSESQPSVPGISFVSPAFDKRLQCLAGTPPENLMNVHQNTCYAITQLPLETCTASY